MIEEYDFYKRVGLPKWAYDFRLTDVDYRNNLKNSIIRNLNTYSNEYDRQAGKILSAELNKNKLIGLTSNLYKINPSSSKDRALSVIKFDSPQLLYFLKDFPCIIVAGSDINHFKEEKIIPFDDLPQWSKYFILSNKNEKNQCFEVLVEGIREYKRSSDTLNKSGEILYATMLSDEMEFIGFGLVTTYFFIDGKDSHNFIMWHDHGGPTLIFKYKKFPAYLITSPSLRFNDTHLNQHKQNPIESDVIGITD